VPALLGAGSAAVRRTDTEAALGYYKQAAAARPGDPVAERRLGQVKLQVTERRVAAARSAMTAGNREQAIGEYREALDAAPELSVLRVEVANILAEGGDLEGASRLLAADPGSDRQVLLRKGEIDTQRKDYGAALEAYRRVLSRDTKDADALRGALAARQGLELQQMPDEYRRIFAAPRITRADLAALVAVKVTALGRAEKADPPVAVDISGSWARDHILRILSLDIMEVYPNHTFQPGAMVRRGDLARAVARVLDLVKWPSSGAPALKDMSANNLFHDAAARVVSAGLMDTTADGAFEPWRPISGGDAAAVIEGLVRLVGP
jgi:tetratricopeptide (TPR) repeat protein